MILGISGKKQSGKTTSGNFIASLFMANLGISRKIHIDDNGDIVISDLFGDENYSGKFDLCASMNSSDYLINKAMDLLNPNIRLYSFADPLKKDICVNILGLEYDQCYGDDNSKNTLTELRWENMPGYSGNLTGQMTGREVMEYVGTHIFRYMKRDVWVSSVIKKIESDKPKLAIITDCRFPDEIDIIKQHNGKVIRLTKSKFLSTNDIETALDKDKYDWSNFDAVINNDDMSIYEQCLEIKKTLEEVSLL